MLLKFTPEISAKMGMEGGDNASQIFRADRAADPSSSRASLTTSLSIPFDIAVAPNFHCDFKNSNKEPTVDTMNLSVATGILDSVPF